MTVDNSQPTIAYFKQLLSNLDLYHKNESSNLMILYNEIIRNLHTIKLFENKLDAITPDIELHAIYQSFAEIAQLAQTLTSPKATTLFNGLNQSNKEILLQIASGDSSKLRPSIVHMLDKINQVKACQLNDLSMLQTLRLSYNQQTLAPDNKYLHYLVSMLPKEPIEPCDSHCMQDLVSLQHSILALNLETPLSSIQDVIAGYEQYLQQLSQELINFPPHENTIEALLNNRKLTAVLSFPNTSDAILMAINRAKRLFVIDYAIVNNLKQLHDIGHITLDQTSVQYLATIREYYQHIKLEPPQNINIAALDYVEQLAKTAKDTPFKQNISELQNTLKGWNKLKEHARHLFFAPRFNKKIKYFGVAC